MPSEEWNAQLMYRLVPIKLHDCRVHGLGSGAELFIVEGDSASKSVVRARCSQNQAVLPMQGKPLNAMKARRSVVEKNELYRQLVTAIGAGWEPNVDLNNVRYDRIIFLFDPDADGIHCGALMLMFFHRWMRPLLDAGHIYVVRPPLYEFSSPQSDERLHAYSDSHYRKLRDALDEKAIKHEGKRYRGLASMNESALLTTCIDPETRNINKLGSDDAEAAIRIFSPGTA